MQKRFFAGDSGNGIDFTKLEGLYETIFIIFDTLMDLHTRGNYLRGYEMDFFLCN